MARTVLIVDDVEFVRKTLSDVLQELGYEVVGIAEDGRQALEQYRRLKPDLVTMDVVMPELGGIEATKEIIQFDKSAVIVMISAMDQMNLIMEAIHAGAKDYIQKPFKTAEVARILERALRGEGFHSASGPQL